MAYTKVRFIAYQVPTVASKYDNASNSWQNEFKIPTGNVNSAIPLQGNVNGLSSDSKARIGRFFNAIKKAYDKLQNIGDDSNTLKIFTAPEFYFRPATDDVSYADAEYKAIIDVIAKTIEADCFRVEENARNLSDWLIMTGTIMHHKDAMNAQNIVLGNVVYYNTCVYLKNNLFDITSEAVEKIHPSSIDGLPSGDSGIGNKKAAFKGDWVEDYLTFSTTPYKKQHLFKVDGIRFGLEICLEHGKALLKNLLSSALVTDTDVDIQLLVAGGMDRKDDKVVVRKNGYFLRNDGLRWQANVKNNALQEYSSNTKITGYNSYMVGNPPIYDVVDLAKPIAIASGDNTLYLKPPAGYETSWNPSQEIRIFKVANLS